MRPFVYLSPSSLDECLKVLGELKDKAKIIAGGTDLVVNMRAETVNPEYVVDIERLRELRFIRIDDGNLRIGAATKIAQIEGSELVRQKAFALYQAASQVGAVQTRNLGTIAGNLASAVPSADMAPPLIAMDAELVVMSSGGQRSLKVEDLFAGPKATVLKPDEVITEVVIPGTSLNDRTWFLKLGRRKALTLAIVNVAVRLRMAEAVVREARVALGAVAPVPMRSRSAEEWLVGRPANAENFRIAAEKAAADSKPITDFRAGAEYRRKMVKVLTKRALSACVGEGEMA
ncbi:MAG TPA: xanthine dehydrogenase family protein subunit M [Firmicutes bacterium]|nr:xanthine dehydrogenase family protein subunit M [Bacillota bacterium]